MKSGEWRVCGASARGAKHERSGLPLQDDYAFRVSSDGACVFALSDGAGSVPYAEIGARAAVEAAIRNTTLLFDEPSPDLDEVDLIERLKSAALGARAELESLAVEYEARLRDFAATLILVVLFPDRVAVLQIGDGAVVVQDCDGRVSGLTTPQIGEFINQTTFLTSPNAVEKAVCVVCRGCVKHVAAFTDGLQMLALKMPEGTPHAPFFTPIFSFLDEDADADAVSRALRSFLDSPRVRERTDDDMTFLAASRRR